jgi:nucleoside-diphosphate-sugar epimerase
LGVRDVDVALGDVTDREAVERGLDGCESVVHCASVYSLDPRMDAAIRGTNVTGTQMVLKIASHLGLNPILHVSSFLALLAEKGTVLTAESPPSHPPGAYMGSKAESDRVARRYQDSGSPVVITYPGSVWGPDDPHDGESCKLLRNALRGFYTLGVSGGLPISDVRDVATLHAAIVDKVRQPGRYMAPSHFVTLRELVQLLARMTGRRLVSVPLPGALILPPAHAVDVVQRILPFRLPINYQAIYSSARANGIDDSGTRREFGIVPRTLDQTVEDQLAWMVRSHRIAARLAGRVAQAV